jgi:basic amino acid/polyamine antiporter, APA family
MEKLVEREERGLLRVLGVTFGLAVTVGDMIGVGIFRTPGDVAAQLDSFWPFIAVWVVGGIFALLGANALAELGTMMPRSGGQYVFVRAALGEYPAFIVGWGDWLSTCGTVAAVAIVIGEYAELLFRPLAGNGPAVAGAAIIFFLALQWHGVRSGGHAQTATSALKAIVLFALIIACFTAGNRGVASAALRLEPERSFAAAFLVALQSVIITYDGWSSPIYVSGELKDPGRSIPRSMFGGLAIVTAIYLLVNFAFLRVVPIATMAGDKLPAGIVAQQIFGPAGDTVLRWITIVALLSAVSANLILAPRVLYAMSRDGLFSRYGSKVNPGGTPTVGLFLSAAVALLFVLTGTFEQVVALLAFFFVGNYMLSFTSLFILRRREPNAERPFRAWGHPWTTGLALVAALGYLWGTLISDPTSTAGAAFLLAISVPAFFLARRRPGPDEALP